MDIALADQKLFKIKTKTAQVSVGETVAVGDFKIDGPGEYEVSGVSVIGVACGPVTTYIVEAEGVRVCLIGKVSEKLTAEQLVGVGSIDIALIPTDMNCKIAVEVARQVDPWVIIPSGFNLTEFMKELGVATSEPVPKYTISRDKLPSELAVVILSSK